MISLRFRETLAFITVLLVSGSIAGTALAASPVLQLPVSGTSKGGDFAGTALSRVPQLALLIWKLASPMRPAAALSRRRNNKVGVTAVSRGRPQRERRR